MNKRINKSQIPKKYQSFRSKLNLFIIQNKTLKGQLDMEDFIHARAGKPGFEWHPAHPRYRLGGCCTF